MLNAMSWLGWSPSDPHTHLKSCLYKRLASSHEDPTLSSSGRRESAWVDTGSWAGNPHHYFWRNKVFSVTCHGFEFFFCFPVQVKVTIQSAAGILKVMACQNTVCITRAEQLAFPAWSCQAATSQEAPQALVPSVLPQSDGHHTLGLASPKRQTFNERRAHTHSPITRIT